MSFSFNATANASQSTIKPKLEGNNIHAVKFDGVEIKDIQGVKDPSQTYKVVVIKFSNDEGVYEHTIFEPKSSDFERTETEFTNKNGNVEKIPQASNVELIMLLFKHLVDAVNPTLAAKIDSGEAKIGGKDWNELRQVLVKMTDSVKGSETNIKLIKNNKGEGIFPGFFAGITKEGKAYIKNNFIGKKLSFAAYEMSKIKNAATAKKTPMDSKPLDLGVSTYSGSDSSELDMNFDLGSL